MNELREVAESLFGILDAELTSWNMAMRALATFIVTVAAIRLGNKRLFGKGTTFDTVVAIMIGSVMSRAITGSGSGSMLGTWGAGFVLIALHWALSWLSFHIQSFGTLVKGEEVLLVRDGEIIEDGMQRTGTTRRDLARAIRQQGNAPDVSEVRLAYMERDGSISIVPKSSSPQVVEVDVRDGVQTVRVTLE